MVVDLSERRSLAARRGPETHVRPSVLTSRAHAEPLLPLAASLHRACGWDGADHADVLDKGRFVQRDPIQSLGSYAYVANRPTAAADPTGKYLVITGGPDEVDKVEDWLGEHGLNAFPGAWEGTTFAYRRPPGDPIPEGGYDLKTEIVWRMIRSRTRGFAYRSMRELIDAYETRKYITEAAASVEWSFDTGESGAETVLEDLGIMFGPNAWAQESICARATALCMLRGYQVRAGVAGRTASFERSVASREAWLKRLGLHLWRREEAIAYWTSRTTHASNDAEGQEDLVPGDIGVIYNNNRAAEPLMNSEAIMYRGGSYKIGASFVNEAEFFGLYSGIPGKWPLASWMEEVTRWSEGAGIRLGTERTGP